MCEASLPLQSDHKLGDKYVRAFTDHLWPSVFISSHEFASLSFGIRNSVGGLLVVA